MTDLNRCDLVKSMTHEILLFLNTISRHSSDQAIYAYKAFPSTASLPQPVLKHSPDHFLRRSEAPRGFSVGPSRPSTTGLQFVLPLPAIPQLFSPVTVLNTALLGCTVLSAPAVPAVHTALLSLLESVPRFKCQLFFKTVSSSPSSEY